MKLVQNALLEHFVLVLEYGCPILDGELRSGFWAIAG